MSPTRSLLVLFALSLAAACRPAAESATAPADATAAAAVAAQDAEPEPDEADDVTTAQTGVQYEIVAERFMTAATPADNVDSPASWQHPDGSTWVIASGKASDQLIVYDGDSGAELLRVGGSGGREGELDRPNGVFVIDDMVFAVERDNARVQAFSLPALQPLGHFGSDVLRKPYGLWIRRVGGSLEVTVSDAYMLDDDELVPPVDALGERFKRWRVVVANGRLQAQPLPSIGATEPAGAIRIPESLWGDEHHDRLLLAEEDQADGTRVKLYDLAGHYRGADLAGC